MSVITVKGDADEARAVASRKASREQENGLAFYQVQPGIWLGNDTEGLAFAIVVGAKPMDYRRMEDSRRLTERVGRHAE